MDIDTAFKPDAIIHYPEGTLPEQIQHTYREWRQDKEGNQLPFVQIERLLNELRRDIAQWYEHRFREPLNTYRLADRTGIVREKFWDDERYAQAFEMLGLDPNERRRTPMPWWNEVAADELTHRITDDGTVDIVLGPRHSIETQLMRNGITLPIHNASVGGLILSTPEPDAPSGYIMLGIRGANANMPNTYYINAGALKVTDQFRKGQSSIYDCYVKEELAGEFGIDGDEVTSGALARIDDHVCDEGPTYIFLVKTPFSRREILGRWQRNKHQDKDEHRTVIAIPNTPEKIISFIQRNYRGMVANRPRGDHERYLLHPGALALAAHIGMPTDELKRLWREGKW